VYLQGNRLALFARKPDETVGRSARLLDLSSERSYMRVRLTVKLADLVDGIDLSHCVEGDVIELSEAEARLLLAEKWAEPAEESELVTCSPKSPADVAADEGRQ
jgi:hypothetical protein